MLYEYGKNEVELSNYQRLLSSKQHSAEGFFKAGVGWRWEFPRNCTILIDAVDFQLGTPVGVGDRFMSVLMVQDGTNYSINIVQPFPQPVLYNVQYHFLRDCQSSFILGDHVMVRLPNLDFQSPQYVWAICYGAQIGDLFGEGSMLYRILTLNEQS